MADHIILFPLLHWGDPEPRRMARLCPDVIAAVQASIALWCARFRQDGWHPTQWAGCCDGGNRTLLEVFVTDTRQQALAAFERDARSSSALRTRCPYREP